MSSANSLRSPTQQASIACKICGGEAQACGEVDFHKSCIEQKGMRIAPSGIAIPYHRCQGCGFVFSTFFDDWSAEDFKQRIYNADYIKVDPEYADARPAGNCQMLDQLFNPYKAALNFIDYGGGNGKLAALLHQQGYITETFDPFLEHTQRPAGRALIVTAYEVFEHAVQPHETLDDMLSFLGDGGVVLFSTLLQPERFDEIGLGWWYIAPRNGHVAIHSRRSLETLFRSRGMKVISQTDNLHFAYRGDPGPLALYLMQVAELTCARQAEGMK